MSDVQVYEDAQANRIVVAPIGHFSAELSRRAIKEFLQLLGMKSVHYVGDCRYMEGYDTETRVAWQKVFGQVQKQILSFTFVGVRSPFVRMGITTMSLFIRTPMQIVDKLDGMRTLR